MLHQMFKIDNKVSLVYFNDTRRWGVVAMQDIKEGEEILWTEKNGIFTSFDSTPETNKLKTENPKLKLIVRLIWQRIIEYTLPSRSNKIYDYTDVLPASISSPLNYTSEELNYFNDNIGTQLNMTRHTEVEDMFDIYYSKIIKFKNIERDCP